MSLYPDNNEMQSNQLTPDHRVEAFLQDLRTQISGDLRDDKPSRILYSTDASIYQIMPFAVLIPDHTEDIHAAVEIAAKHKLPVLPRCSGSSLAGQAVNQALVIDMTRHLNRIIELNPEERWVRVQPGMVLDELNLQLKSSGLQFGPDPASSNRAAIGGIVANNSSGSHSTVYGITVDHLLETKVILSDGSTANFTAVKPREMNHYKNRTGLEGDIYRKIENLTQTHAEVIHAQTPIHWRRCGGYNLDRFIDGIPKHSGAGAEFNLAKLVCGSEGTLGVMTEIKLHLVPIPKMTVLAIVQFDDLHNALNAVKVISETHPTAIELMERTALQLCRQVPEYARLLDTFLTGTPNCILITEYAGDSSKELEGKVKELRIALSRQSIPSQISEAVEEHAQANVWAVRKVGLGLLMSIKGDHKPIPFIEDTAVPIEHLADYIPKLESFCQSIGTKLTYYGHASAGCLHVRPLINTKNAGDIQKMKDIMSFVCELLTGYGGVLSSEHGDGRARSWLNERFFGKDLYGLFRQVKGIFDPENIFNPGNIVDSPAIDEHLRYGPNYTTAAIKTELDFSQELGFDRAVELCHGAGVCRKKTTGVMCPSFIATSEEEHSTRGRANMLRAALSGVLPIDAFTSPRMYQVMELCVGCKACKAECPSSVDMAKIKTEFLYHYHQEHGIPFRDRLFANIHLVSRLSSGWFAPWINRFLRARWVREAMDRWMGISANRSLPVFTSQPFTKWFKKQPKIHGLRKKVVLFHDTFNTYHDPEIAIAAVKVLEEAGYEVFLPGHKCCGRPMLSKGMIQQAKKAASQTVACLFPFAKENIPIVGLEPSCLLTIRDDYFSLLPGDDRVKKIAEQCFLFEEFVMDRIQSGEMELKFSASNRKILLHAHCHQKALSGSKPVYFALSLPHGYQVEEIDSSCCGMAGAFGYEKEHYDISMSMANRRIVPAVQNAGPETIVASSGVSCRQQILHTTGKRAFHPAEILCDALANHRDNSPPGRNPV